MIRSADKRVVREVAGVPDELIRHFSKRRAAIEDRYRDLASQYRLIHGREPPREAQLKLAQQATLESRDAKPEPRTLAEQLTSWRDDAGRVQLPSAYVDDFVELGYATTTAQAQGRTVDTAHVLVDDTTSREGL